MPHYNYNEVAIINIVTLCNVRTPDEAKNWLLENQKYQVIMNPYPTATQNAYNISVLTEQGQLDWLKEASDFIDYKDTYKFIEELHMIHNSNGLVTLIEKEISKGNSIDYTLTDILAGLNLSGFQAYNYENYMSFKFDFVAKKINFAILPNDHNMKDYCFSFPFFRSMIANKNIIDPSKCSLCFVKIKLSDGDTIMFKLNFDNGKVIEYYDYSHNPPLRSGTIFIAGNNELSKLFVSHKIYF